MVSTVLIVLNVCLALVLISQLFGSSPRQRPKPVEKKGLRARERVQEKRSMSKRDFDLLLADVESIKKELGMLA